MLEKRGADWGDRVRLIGLGVNYDLNMLVSHIEDKKWTNVEHYAIRNDKCTAYDDYGVQEIILIFLQESNF